jgi:hypothetical protein
MPDVPPRPVDNTAHLESFKQTLLNSIDTKLEVFKQSLLAEVDSKVKRATFDSSYSSSGGGGGVVTAFECLMGRDYSSLAACSELEGKVQRLFVLISDARLSGRSIKGAILEEELQSLG